MVQVPPLLRQRHNAALGLLYRFSFGPREFETLDVNPGCPSSHTHTFSARLLFDKTFSQPDVFAVANYPVVALSVFCSIVFLMHRHIQYWKNYYGVLIFPWRNVFFIHKINKTKKQLEKRFDTNKTTLETFSSLAEVVQYLLCLHFEAFKALILSSILSMWVLQNLVIFSL